MLWAYFSSKGRENIARLHIRSFQINIWGPQNTHKPRGPIVILNILSNLTKKCILDDQKSYAKSNIQRSFLLYFKLLKSYRPLISNKVFYKTLTAGG